jgi:hypothetical protein
MKKILAFSFFLCCLNFGFSQTATISPSVFASTITVEDLRQHLTAIASENFEGRETGTLGQRKAAQYLVDQMVKLGLPAIGENKSYLQTISFISQSWVKVEMKIGDKEQRHMIDFYGYPGANPTENAQTFSEGLFLGYGIDDAKYSDYDGVDVKGKLLLVFDGEPRKNDNYLISGSTTASEWTTNWRKKVKLAKDKGAAAVLIIDRNFKQNLQDARKVILSNRLEIGKDEQADANYVPNFFLSTEVARDLLGSQAEKAIKIRDKMDQKGKNKALNFPCTVKLTDKKQANILEGANVLGYIEGTDPVLKNEIVMVTAHYDHLGKRGETIFFGADDNGSGTSTILEVCQALVEAKKAGAGPRRTVVCMWVSGEEKGLLGSQYYSENPIFPLAQTVVDVNVDMVGRVDTKHENNPDYIYVIGADRLSSELHQINEQANATYTHLELDYTYNSESDPNRYYYRSDHYNFAKKGIPAIFFFNGTHDDYHRATDTVDKINFEKMAKIGQLVFYTTWELANRAERIKVDKK